MNAEERLQRAGRVANILDDPIFKEAEAHIEAELWRQFQAAIPTDLEALSQIKAMQYMHVKYLAFLKSAVNDGKVVKFELDRARPRPKGY